MSDYIEPTPEMLQAASEFWGRARERVERIADESGFTLELEDHDDPFLYELYDYGYYTPTDEEVLEGIKEVLRG